MNHSCETLIYEQRSTLRYVSCLFYCQKDWWLVRVWTEDMRKTKFIFLTNNFLGFNAMTSFGEKLIQLKHAVFISDQVMSALISLFALNFTTPYFYTCS